MVQKIHPRDVIWVPSSSSPIVILGSSKQPDATSIYKEVRGLRHSFADQNSKSEDDKVTFSCC